MRFHSGKNLADFPTTNPITAKEPMLTPIAPVPIKSKSIPAIIPEATPKSGPFNEATTQITTKVKEGGIEMKFAKMGSKIIDARRANTISIATLIHDSGRISSTLTFVSPLQPKQI